MTAYIPRTDEPIPQSGGDKLKHYVKIFESTDRITLESEINGFFETLRLSPVGFPYIRQLELATAKPQQNGDTTYTAFIHYVLAE